MIDIVLSILFFGGLMIAGSDGEYFPWLNLVGVAMIGLVGVIANRLYHE